MKSVKHSLRINDLTGLLDSPRMARLYLTPCANGSPWLDLFWELDFEDFASETSVPACTGATLSHSPVPTLAFPLFETSLPDAADPRFVPFKAAFVLGSGPFADEPFAEGFRVLVEPQAGAKSAFVARDADATFDHENDGSAARLFCSSCSGVSSFGISTYQ